MIGIPIRVAQPEPPDCKLLGRPAAALDEVTQPLERVVVVDRAPVTAIAAEHGVPPSRSRRPARHRRRSPAARGTDAPAGRRLTRRPGSAARPRASRPADDPQPSSIAWAWMPRPPPTGRTSSARRWRPLATSVPAHRDVDAELVAVLAVDAGVDSFFDAVAGRSCKRLLP